MKKRKISEIILQRNNWKTGRIIVLTGARQIGKTTLVRHLFPNAKYISIDDPITREQYAKLTATQLHQLSLFFIFDEVQKEPQLIDSVKAIYDEWDDTKFILLGSSQLILLKQVKESLAGRVIIIDFCPLTLPELQTQSWDDLIVDSFFQKFVLSTQPTQWLPSVVMDNRYAEKQGAFNHYIEFGGYPVVSDPKMSDEEKRSWLQNYVRTYLERDIRDLASFRDLNPFVKLQHYLAQNTATLVNATSIAKLLSLSVKTVQNYIHYFEISFQALTLQAWALNANKRLSKMPKIHYLDPGIVHAILNKTGGITGNEFESAVVAEIAKQLTTIVQACKLYHLRTHDGKEIDLLIEFPDFYYAFEIKMTDKVQKNDAKNFSGLAEILDKPIKQAFILSNDIETKYFDHNVVAVNAAMFLG